MAKKVKAVKAVKKIKAATLVKGMAKRNGKVSAAKAHRAAFKSAVKRAK